MPGVAMLSLCVCVIILPHSRNKHFCLLLRIFCIESGHVTVYIIHIEHVHVTVYIIHIEHVLVDWTATVMQSCYEEATAVVLAACPISSSVLKAGLLMAEGSTASA